MLLVVLVAILALSSIFLWYDQLRYAGWASVEEDRWRGYSDRAILDALGEPHVRYGTYYSIGAVENVRHADRSWEYRTTFGTLYIYLRGHVCVESLYFGRDVVF